MVKSVEPDVQQRVNSWFDNYCVEYFLQQASVNSEIDSALQNALSKRGGSGGNLPDAKLLMRDRDMKQWPIMVEYKGYKDKLAKLNADGDVENSKKDGSPHRVNIDGFAVNGAVYYANAIIEGTESYKDTIAIGVTGYINESKELQTEIGVYYVSENNLGVAKKVGEYTDLSFLEDENFDEFIRKVKDIDLTDEERERQHIIREQELDNRLAALNQIMNDDLEIVVDDRVQFVAGLIMAALGVADKVSSLKLTDLAGQTGKKSNDGTVVMDKIQDFLDEREIPDDKKDTIIRSLQRIFLDTKLTTPNNGETTIKKVYKVIYEDIMPLYTSGFRLDFTGRLFYVLNAWVRVPDGDKNDVVLTPRYVTDMMAKLAKVDKNSYVWDWALGSGGFLISAMNQMIRDAENTIKSPQKLEEKKALIRGTQLLGIEKLPPVYMLAVLNMILMDDGSTNILNENSLTGFDGKYNYGNNKGKDFPANVFLLNPPYSAPGKGMVFVEKALAKMKGGNAAVLIQENAGSGNATEFNKRILEHNSLTASIHMPDIFYGKAGVQTAIYVFKVGEKHNVKSPVRFVDFSNDGYARQNRKKSSADVNLRDVDHAYERYQEVVDLVLYGKDNLHYFTEDEFFEDYITLNGDDWTFSQHRVIDDTPTDEDFRRVVADYLAWEVSQVLKGEM